MQEQEKIDFKAELLQREAESSGLLAGSKRVRNQPELAPGSALWLKDQDDEEVHSEGPEGSAASEEAASAALVTNEPEKRFKGEAAEAA